MNSSSHTARKAGLGPQGFFGLLWIIALGLSVAGCQNADSQQTNTTTAKVGVLLVNHGSRSETWRNALMDLETTVRDTLLSMPQVQGTKTAFMEYNEPSIATRMREFDAEGYTDVVVVPVFLTVSPHTFDDLPTILGQKEDPQSLELLKIEKIERYTPKARVHYTPLLDFTDLLKKNILRRAQALSADPANEGIVLIGYGDATYEREWVDLFDQVGQYVRQQYGIGAHSHGWCGHIAHYDPNKTAEAIDKVLATKQRALVVPVLVAHDEMFQVKIIGDGIQKIAGHEQRVAYKPDAILPDANVSQWIIDAVREQAHKLQTTQQAR